MQCSVSVFVLCLCVPSCVCACTCVCACACVRVHVCVCSSDRLLRYRPVEDKLCKCGRCKQAAIFVRSASCPSTAAPSPRDIYQYVLAFFLSCQWALGSGWLGGAFGSRVGRAAKPHAHRQTPPGARPPCGPLAAPPAALPCRNLLPVRTLALGGRRALLCLLQPSSYTPSFPASPGLHFPWPFGGSHYWGTVMWM